ncbi:MAG: abortive infection family protein [Ahrensia sp.]
MFDETILDKTIRLQNLLISHATGGSAEQQEYEMLRRELAGNPRSRELVPRFVRTCSDLEQFWGWIKYEKSTYAERRTLIWDSFASLRERLEFGERLPTDSSASVAIGILNAEHVATAWERAIERKKSDPEGAITAARTLLESTCKTLLDDMSIEYPKNADLPKLWALASESLQLSPNQHTESVFKQILGNCQSVVNNLGSIRNKIGDAHGQGRKPVKPQERHAELAINLAGTMATFIIQTWQERQKNP